MHVICTVVLAGTNDGFQLCKLVRIPPIEDHGMPEFALMDMTLSKRLLGLIPTGNGSFQMVQNKLTGRLLHENGPGHIFLGEDEQIGFTEMTDHGTYGNDMSGERIVQVEGFDVFSYNRDLAMAAVAGTVLLLHENVFGDMVKNLVQSVEQG